MYGRIAQSVERWSNKPLVKGSSPFVTTILFLCFLVVGSHASQPCAWGSLRRTQAAFVAERLRRYVQVVVNFVGVGSIPTECKPLFWSPSSFLFRSFLLVLYASSVHIGIGGRWGRRLKGGELILVPFSARGLRGERSSETNHKKETKSVFLSWRYRDSSPGRADHNR
jgi:hypothetical protein